MGSAFLTQALIGFLKVAVVLIPIGGEVRITLAAQQRIAEGFSANDRVAEMVPEGQAIVKMKGRSPGINPLVLTDDKGRSQLFLIVVPKPNK